MALELTQEARRSELVASVVDAAVAPNTALQRPPGGDGGGGGP